MNRYLEQKEFHKNVPFTTTASEHRSHLEKCVSQTDLTTCPKKSSIEIPYVRRTLNLGSHSSQSTDFIFFMKIKMINLLRVLNTEMHDEKEKLNEGPHELFRELGKRINIFQRQSAKKLCEATNRIKELQIKIIEDETQLKTQETQIVHLTSKLGKIMKARQNEVDNYQRKLTESEAQNGKLIKKMQQLTHINDDIERRNAQLASEYENSKKEVRLLGKESFELQKKSQLLLNQEKLSNKKLNRQIQELKEQILKFSIEKTGEKDEVRKKEETIKTKEAIIYELRWQLKEVSEEKQGNKRELQETIKQVQSLKKQRELLKVKASNLEILGKKQHIKTEEKLMMMEGNLKDAEKKMSECQSKIQASMNKIMEQKEIFDSYVSSTEVSLKIMAEKHEKEIRLKQEQNEVRMKEKIIEIESKCRNKLQKEIESYENKLHQLKKIISIK